MLKKNIFCILISVLIMLIFPWCAITFIKGDSSMAACFMLFYAINPIASMTVGIFSGRNIRVSWPQPILLSFLFLIGTWSFFDRGEQVFINYAAIYLVLGCAAMLITSFVVKGTKKRIVS